MARDAPSILAGPRVKGERLRLCWALGLHSGTLGAPWTLSPRHSETPTTPSASAATATRWSTSSPTTSRSATGRERPVLPWAEPAARWRAWPASLPEPSPARSLGELMARVLAESNHLHHPRYVGHQVTAPLPLGGARRARRRRSSTTAWPSTRWARSRRAMERARRRAGWPRSSASARARDGVLTSGGSVGNLTALLAARQAKAGLRRVERGRARRAAARGARLRARRTTASRARRRSWAGARRRRPGAGRRALPPAARGAAPTRSPRPSAPGGG